VRSFEFARRRADAPAPAATLRRLDIQRSSHSLGMSHILASQAFLTRHLREALDLGEPARIAYALATETIYSWARSPRSWCCR
jgi:hypothetical protein